MKSKNWKKTIIRDNKTVKIAIKALELSELQVLLVVNIKNKFVGTVTDGDIRRVIEKKQNIENICAKDFMNHSPKIMNENTLAIDALKHMKENSISQVLILNDNDKYIGIVHILDIIKQGISYE